MFNLKHLSVLTTPRQYLKIVHQMYSDNDSPVDGNPDYWQMIPTYLISRCPICDHPYYEQLDTNSLFWWNEPDGQNVFGMKKEKTLRCEHFFLVQRFINLHGMSPELSDSEVLNRRRYNAEVPHIIPFILTPDSNCQAVMHSLPICRIVENRFVPSYTLYMVTYFDYPENHRSLKRQFSNFHNKFELEHDFSGGKYPTPQYLHMREAEIWFDLEYYIEDKKLLWIEPDSSDLALHDDQLGSFPYGDIEGRRLPYSVTLPPYPINREQVNAQLRYLAQNDCRDNPHRVRLDTFSIKAEDGKYCLLNQDNQWVVRRTEQGQQNYFQQFDNEDEACHHLFHLVTGYKWTPW